MGHGARVWIGLLAIGTANKPNLETTYARRTFYFSLDGSTIAPAPACPAP